MPKRYQDIFENDVTFTIKRHWWIPCDDYGVPYGSDQELGIRVNYEINNLNFNMDNFPKKFSIVVGRAKFKTDYHYNFVKWGQVTTKSLLDRVNKLLRELYFIHCDEPSDTKLKFIGFMRIKDDNDLLLRCSEKRKLDKIIYRACFEEI